MSANHGPDFIWATFEENVSEQTCDVYAQTTAEGFVEPPLRYRRDDLPPTDTEVMAHPKVKALVDAAKAMNDAFYSNGNVTERHLKACEAGVALAATLAAIQEDKK